MTASFVAVSSVSIVYRDIGYSEQLISFCDTFPNFPIDISYNENTYSDTVSSLLLTLTLIQISTGVNVKDGDCIRRSDRSSTGEPKVTSCDAIPGNAANAKCMRSNVDMVSKVHHER